MVNENKTNETNPEREPRTEVREPAAEGREAQVLNAGQWLRAVVGIEAPFGYDGMPTVWG